MSKVGVDDFLAAGGTIAELKALARKFEPQDLGRIRLSQDDRLRALVEDLKRRWWAEVWKGRGGHSDRDIFHTLIDAATRSGKIHADGVKVVMSWGVLQVRAKVSRRTLAKALARLEELGFLYRDNEGRKREKTGAFVLRAKVNQYGGSEAEEEKVTQELRKSDPGGLHSRALPDVPRLRYSRPAWAPKKRGFVTGTRKIRESKPPPARERIERLGKIRGAVVDALEVAGGTLALHELCEVLHRKRARDVRRRILPMLEGAGVIEVAGDVIRLASGWREALESERREKGEVEADELAEDRRKRKSRAYRERHKVRPDRHHANVAGADGHVEDLRPVEVEHDESPPEPEVSDLARAVRDYLDRSPHDACQPPGWIGVVLWADEHYPGKPTPAEVRTAIEELGGERYLRSRLRAAEGQAA